MVRHKNDYGYWEEVDRLPIPGCACGKCGRAADRDAERQAQRSQNRQAKQSRRSFPPNNGSVGGRSGYVQQRGDRTVGYYGRDNEGKVVTNDGLNASYVRDDDGTVSVDDAKDDPYEPYNRFD